MAEVLRVFAVPGVLARDPRVTASHRFLGRDRAPQNGPGLALGHISAGLYDAAKLHKGEPVDVDAQFPIVAAGAELRFDIDSKDPHKRLEERKALAKLRTMIAEGALSTTAPAQAPAAAAHDDNEEHAQ